MNEYATCSIRYVLYDVIENTELIQNFSQFGKVCGVKFLCNRKISRKKFVKPGPDY